MPGQPLVIAAVAVVALLAGAGVAALVSSGSSPSAAAASDQSSAAPSAAPSASAPARRPGRGVRGPFGGLLPGGGGFFSGVLGAVHGQLVVPRSGGGYQTEDIQRGGVTAVSSSSITIKSADGFIKTYRVTGSVTVIPEGGPVSAVKVGNQVSVTATVTGAAATVTHLIDLSQLGNGGFLPGANGQGAGSG